jgi:hydrogenase nickel incorporation protein HypB
LIPLLQRRGHKVGVIVGDITTSCDANRFQPLGIPIAQINTQPFGGACHLGANVVLGAMEELDDASMDMILLENVGNLVCPAEFDTGADRKVVVLSVTEGEDKPLKYPLMFRTCDLAVISKTDLTEAAGADLPLLRENLGHVNPELEILETSARLDIGMGRLAEWIAGHAARAREAPRQARPV